MTDNTDFEWEATFEEVTNRSDEKSDLIGRIKAAFLST